MLNSPVVFWFHKELSVPSSFEDGLTALSMTLAGEKVQIKNPLIMLIKLFDVIHSNGKGLEKKPAILERKEHEVKGLGEGVIICNSC